MNTNQPIRPTLQLDQSEFFHIIFIFGSGVVSNCCLTKVNKKGREEERGKERKRRKKSGIGKRGGKGKRESG